MSSPNHMLHNKILSLPISDFPSLQSSVGKSPPLSKEREGGHQKNNYNDDDIAAKAPLLLLSLPKTLDLKDLSSSQFFVSENNECRLINESKGVTYDLIKVESSNAYVMFPPPTTSSTETNEHSSAQEPPCKRIKTGNTNNENNDAKSTIQGRLLREKNTFFMECEPPTKSNLYQLVHEYLTEHCIFPSSSTCTNEEVGKSISDLSEMFLFSQKEIHDVLERMCAFPIHVPNSNQDDVKYGILSEEVERDTWNVILGVLAEWDGGEDYANKGVNVREMVKKVMESDDSMEEGIVSYCIKNCQINGEMDNQVVKLDPNYVSVYYTIWVLKSLMHSLCSHYLYFLFLIHCTEDCKKISTSTLQFTNCTLETI